ncbi:MAG: serine hydrolase domain-containing protein [Anaerolineae bacterium]
MTPTAPVLLSALAPGQEVTALPPDGIERAMQGGLERCFPAAQVLVCVAGRVVWHRAYGAARLEALFDLASVTKLFTTTAFLSLVSEGRAALHTPLADVIPEFAARGVDADGLRRVDASDDPETWNTAPVEAAYAGQRVDPRRVTFRHLLTHTGGLAPWPLMFKKVGQVPPPEGVANPEARARRLQAGLEIVCAYPFAGPPDSGVRYSDQGLILLGEAVARLHGAPLDAAIAARVLRPLGLARTTFNPVLAGFPLEQIVPTEFDARWRGRRAHGEVHDENAASLGGVAGHAGLFSTARDLATFGQAWLDCVLTGAQGPLPVPPALAREAVREQAVDGDLRRGLGWLLKAGGGVSSMGARMSADSFGHTGYTGTSLFIDPTRALLVACLTNRVYHGRDPEPISEFRPALHDAIVAAVEQLAG